jgi:hypothetical protein
MNEEAGIAQKPNEGGRASVWLESLVFRRGISKGV